jgi:trigger factor
VIAKVSEPESWKRIIEIEVPGEEVEKLFEEKLQSVKKDISIDGFRPGKVPNQLIRQRYGEAIRKEVVEDLVSKKFEEVCTEKKIDPVSKGRIKEMAHEAGKPLTFSIEVEVDPAIDIEGYKKLKIKVAPKKIRDDDVDASFKGLIDRFADFTKVDRPSKKGDYVRLAYQKVVIDGQERPDVKSPTYPIELGAEHRIKDFDKGLIGHSAGDTVTLSVKFPKDYADADVAGKGGEFTITINEVQEKVPADIATVLPKLGEFKDEAGLRDQLRTRLMDEALEKARHEAHSEAIEKLIKANPFEVPPARIETFMDYLMDQARQERRQNEAIPSREDIEKKYHDVAVRTLKRQRILDFIADKEKITATQEDVDAQIRRIADQYKQPFETMKQTLRQDGTTLRIREDIREQKTLDFLVELPEAAGK